MMPPLPSQLNASLFIATLNGIKIPKRSTAIYLPSTTPGTAIVFGMESARAFFEVKKSS
jgi:hypothetical protein